MSDGPLDALTSGSANGDAVTEEERRDVARRRGEEVVELMRGEQLLLIDEQTAAIARRAQETGRLDPEDARSFAELVRATEEMRRRMPLGGSRPPLS